MIELDEMVAYRLPSETSVRQRVATHRPLSQRPRLNILPRSLPKTGAALRLLPPKAFQVNKASPSLLDPNVASSLS